MINAIMISFVILLPLSNLSFVNCAERSFKYISYSRELFIYFVSDIDENEIVMQMMNPRPDVTADKFILADDFTCYDDGEILGPVSPQVIQRLRHSN